MIEGFVQLTTGLGVMGLLVVWQADSLMEMFTLRQEQQRSLKRHKRSALKSAVVLVALGPLFTVMGSSMSFAPVPSAIDRSVPAGSSFRNGTVNSCILV